MKEETLQMIPQKTKLGYYEKLYTKNLDNSEEINKFLETFNLPIPNHEEIIKLIRG